MTVNRRAALAAPFLLAGGRAVRAQGTAFPNRPVRIVVPYSPGGVSDITARLIAEPLAAAWGQPVPVENRAGADGVIGTEAVAKSPPDGHVLSLVSVGHPVNAAFYKLPFDTMRDFSFVTQTTSTPLVLCAARGFAASTPAELVAHAKRNPGVTFAGTSGVVRLAPVLFAQRAGLEMTYVPYRGSTQAHPDLMAGRVTSCSTPCRRRCRTSSPARSRRWRPRARRGRRNCLTRPRWPRASCRTSRPRPGAW
jgi:tripartite-type tricarboxylate transporter receptor subunit TctC